MRTECIRRFIINSIIWLGIWASTSQPIYAQGPVEVDLVALQQAFDRTYREILPMDPELAALMKEIFEALKKKECCFQLSDEGEVEVFGHIHSTGEFDAAHEHLDTFATWEREYERPEREQPVHDHSEHDHDEHEHND